MAINDISHSLLLNKLDFKMKNDKLRWALLLIIIGVISGSVTGQVTGLRLAGMNGCSVPTLSWDPYPGATSYNLHFNGIWIPVDGCKGGSICTSYNVNFVKNTNQNVNYDLTFSSTVYPGATPTDVYVTPVNSNGEISGASSSVLKFDLEANSLSFSQTYNSPLDISTGTAYGSIILDNGFSFLGSASQTFSAVSLSGCMPRAGVKKLEDSDDSKDNMVTNSCFPNPTHGEFTVRMDLPENQTSEIRVYDSMGKLVKTVVASATETLVSIEDQPAGIYFVRYTVDGKDQSAKIVKL
jgi:hypothetical protein